MLIGGVAFVLYDPFSAGGGFIGRAELIIPGPAGDAALAGAEPDVRVTDPPPLAALALRYQPTVIVSALDPLHDPGPLAVRGSPNDDLRYATPVDDAQDSFLIVAALLGAPPSVLRLWPLDLPQVDPFRSAQVYFHELPRTTRHSYPGLPGGLISLEYWFFYPLNLPSAARRRSRIHCPSGSSAGRPNAAICSASGRSAS